MKATFKHHQLIFKTPGGTSRGILKTKDSYILRIRDGHKEGVGECSLIQGLSPDYEGNLEMGFQKLKSLLESKGDVDLSHSLFYGLPALKFAYEMAVLNLQQSQDNLWFNSKFNQGHGIPINGLIWMGSKEHMYNQIKDKIKEGFKCLKLKIAAINFKEELELLQYIRSQFTPEEIELRVDANGGFKTKEALEKLKQLSEQQLHSIEQPIQPGQWEAMAELCEKSPLDIALDEELISIEKDRIDVMLNTIKPKYIILKPSLLGGFQASADWINAAENIDIGWWATSALESNIGLTAIAQWVSTLETNKYQGLGTGKLFTNNTPSTLTIREGYLFNK